MNKLFFTALCGMAMLAGCQQAEEIENISEILPMSIEASIESTMGSRYESGNNDDTPNSLVFTKGDEIGVFVDDRAVEKWTKKENGNWEPEATVYWPNEVKGCDFYAFFPYPENTTDFSKENVPMPSLAEQTGTIESLSTCDFMVATALDKKYTDDNGKISFTGETNCFKHVSSLVAITILKESDLAKSTINKISFEGTGTELGSSTTYSFATGNVTINTNNDKVESELNISMTEEEQDKTLYFILNSGASLSNITFTIEYTTDSKNYKATKTGLGDTNLTSGNRYNFNLNITDGVLNISGCEIQGWGAGTPMNDIIINTPTEQQSQNNENT